MEKMELTPPRTLAELAGHADKVINERLSELGSADIMHKTIIASDEALLVSSLRPVEAIEPGCLTFATDKKFLARVEESDAAAVIVPPHLEPVSKPCLKAPQTRLAFTVMLELTQPEASLVQGISENIRFKDRRKVAIGDGSIIGDFCYIGENVAIGENCLIYPHVFIDDNVVIGDGCIVYPRVSLFRNTTMGRKVIIHSGAVIGDDGFGYNQVPDLKNRRLNHLKNVHVGGVVIEDHVEVGSQVCIDRGLAGNTVIGAGTKIDNLVQIAHNVKIGRDNVIVSQVGMSGHSITGDRAFLLGQVGVGPGASIGNDAIITGQSGVTTKIPDGHALWSGTPARKSDVEYKLRAISARELPRLREFMRLFKKADSFEDLKEMFFKAESPKGSEEK